MYHDKKSAPVLVMNYLPTNGEDKSSMIFASPDKVGSIAILGELQGLPADWVKKSLDYSQKLTDLNDEMLSALEMAHSYLCLKSIDGDTEGDMVRKGLAYTIRKARGEA